MSYKYIFLVRLWVAYWCLKSKGARKPGTRFLPAAFFLGVLLKEDELKGDLQRNEYSHCRIVCTPAVILRIPACALNPDLFHSSSRPSRCPTLHPVRPHSRTPHLWRLSCLRTATCQQTSNGVKSFSKLWFSPRESQQFCPYF